MNDQPITLDEYKEVSEEFFPKYHFVAEQLSKNGSTIRTPDPEDVLKVMESLAGLVLKKRTEDKKVTLGFNKQNGTETD